MNSSFYKAYNFMCDSDTLYSLNCKHKLCLCSVIFFIVVMVMKNQRTEGSYKIFHSLTFARSRGKG